MKYKNYIFDLYGTLIDIHTDEDSLYLWKKMSSLYDTYGCKYKPLELKKKYKEYCKNEIKRLSKKDRVIEIDIDKVFLKLLKDKNKSIKISKKELSNIALIFRILSRDYMKLYDGVLETLNTLKKKGCHVYLLSNAQRSFTYPEIVSFNLDKYFDDIFISSDLGIKKPDKEYLNKLIKKHKLKKEECVLIGNELDSDIKVACLNNIDSIFFNSNKYTKNDIKKYEELFKGYKLLVVNKFKEILKW